MKNLNKKIRIVVLSGLALVGGSFAASSSVAHAQRSDLLYQKFDGDNIPVSKHEYNRNVGLKYEKPRDEDVNQVVLAGEQSDFYNYKVLYVDQMRSLSDKDNKDFKALKKRIPRLNKPSICFVDVEHFFYFMNDFGYLLEGIYNINVRGVDYIIKFDFNF